MHGCRPGLTLCLLAISLSLLPGCENGVRQPPGEPAPQAAIATPNSFDPATAGTIQGQVTWKGDIPHVTPFRVRTIMPPPSPPQPKRLRDNPNAPAVDARSRGVGNAVVYLRAVDPRHARPWDLPPVRVEQRDQRFHVRQGASDSLVGFVRRGDAVEMLSRDEAFYSLHAGGAAFFTLVFPDPDQPLFRRLNQKGLVELTSGAGSFWMRAYLFVADHPYYARTDADGRFTLRQVPPGRYDVVCWLPDWHEARHERDPETGLVTRLFFQPPLEVVRPLTLGPGEAQTMDFQVTAEDFGRRLLK
jgi:hypothetical protein